jgi:hypothetical protein
MIVQWRLQEPHNRCGRPVLLFSQAENWRCLVQTDPPPVRDELQSMTTLRSRTRVDGGRSPRRNDVFLESDQPHIARNEAAIICDVVCKKHSGAKQWYNAGLVPLVRSAD